MRYPPPGYNPNFRDKPPPRSRLGLLIVICVAVLIAAVGLVWGGIALVSFAESTNKDSRFDVPDKYHDESFPPCASFVSSGPDIPKNADSVIGSVPHTDHLLYCAFNSENLGGPSVTFKASWSFTDDVMTGSEAEHDEFIGKISGSSYDLGPANVGIGQDAHWFNYKDSRSCSVVVLDRNAVFEVGYSPAKAGNQESEVCRGPLRKITRELYETVQPK